jgi:hypothetical protein
VVAADHPHFAVGRAREHVPAVDDDAVRGHLHPHPLVALPVAVRVREVVRWVDLDGGHLGVEIHAAPNDIPDQ